MWVFPITVLTLVFVFKGFQCQRLASWTFRRCRRWCCCRCARVFCSIEDEDSDEETSESGGRGNVDEERGNLSVVRVIERDVEEMNRALAGGARDDAGGGGVGGERFEPDLWRYLAVRRDLERRRRRYDVGEESTHREPMVELPNRTRVDPPSAYDRTNKAVAPASRRVLKYLPRVIVGSPRWFQFLRANGHIDVKITPQGIVRHVLDHSAEECVVCCDGAREIAFRPCGHLATCAACSRHPEMRRCPLCQAPIKERIRIFNA